MESNRPIDVLAVAAHPDDAELFAGGTLCLLGKQGYRTAVVDLTEGELGSRGSRTLRREEAARASVVMGLACRVNLEIPDGNIANTSENRMKLIRVVRRLRPRIVLAGAPTCRHPDHEDAMRLTVAALFSSGLRKIETTDDEGTEQDPHRPEHVLHYMQNVPFEPTLVVDVSEVWDQRISAIRAFKSQFFNPSYEAGEDEPETYVSNSEYLGWIESRARFYGYPVGAMYGEPYLYRQGPLRVTNLPGLL